MSNPTNKVAFVTAASRGIGAATAKRLAADGAAVAVTYSSNSDAATKGAVKMFTQGLAREVGSRGVIVNNIQPGRVEDIGAMVAFVAGPGAGYVTGTSLTVDGGANA
jgi:NAD(P)-dependent dehydrogenase (short-subunit alcohol dehydrogenase family)